MAKHSKNNIISYEEAKRKKVREREDRRRQSAKHFRGEKDEQLYEAGFVDDAPIYEDAVDNNYEDFAGDSDENTGAGERENASYARRSRDHGKREPLPRNLINLITITVMVIALVVLCVAFYNYYVVENINVEGNHQIKYHDIMELCGVEYKQSMLTVKAEEVIESIETKQPMVEVLHVKKVWPNIIEIHVQERYPVCYLVLKGSQKCALIGKDNICLSKVESYLEGDLPIIYGVDVGSATLGKELTDGESRKLEVLKLIQDAMIETGCISQLESININNTTNIVMKSVHGTTIKMGDVTNLVKKFSNVKTMLNYLLSQNDTDKCIVATGDGSVYGE